MPTIFNSPILTLLQSGPKTPEQQVQRVTSPLQQSVNGRQRISLPDFTTQPIQIKPIIPARDATGTAQSVQHNTHTDQVPTNINERLKRNRQILGDVVETAIDLTPVIGDIKGLTWDPIKAGIEGGFGAGLSMAGLGLIGLVPGGSAIKVSRRVGSNAVDMFRTYNKTRNIDIPENSELYSEIKKLISEARKRYEIIDNTDITDDEIAKALYGRAQELGQNSAARYSTGEPHLLFRGDTRRYETLKERPTPNELAEQRGTMDNSLGNLFLGEFPHEYQGIDRYIGTYNTHGNVINGSSTGSKVIVNERTLPSWYEWDFDQNGNFPWKMNKLYTFQNQLGEINTVFKLPDEAMVSGVNDINPFIVRTPKVRDASWEISVLNDARLPMGIKLKKWTITL